ncbi:STE/STE11/cdc15 protein kinase [Lentinula aciculospora]|uniref:STE/STE11/cdc15 protein kinase n=1 Tax=Lentinula aciculospora TaxID=153920 RepID=A0A9W8ZZ74_9AGAR|nr:STE/STE11/cdc15 protein kinase [Lentinula aciculospora]
MAVAAVSVSSPFAMSSRLAAAPPPAASSSRSKQPTPSSYSPTQESTIKPFNRIRSSLEQSLRTATRSKKAPAPPVDEFATVSAKSKGKEKEKQKEKVTEEKQGMLRRLESKVNFRRVTPSPQPPVTVSPSPKEDKVRSAGSTSYTTPSLRMASVSSPALHLSSQALPSPKSRSAIPASSSSTSDALVTPFRERSRQPDTPTTPTPRHRPTKSAPIDIPTSSSVLSLHSPPETPRRPRREQFSPPDTPTPVHGSRGSKQASSSTSHLPLNSPPSPSYARRHETSSNRARSPSISRTRVVSPPPHRGLTSSSTSHLPSNSSPSPPPTPTPSRPLDARRPSLDSPRRTTFGREGSESPSPAIRPRPISPNQRAYADNRHFNVSTTSLSLSGPSNPEHRELIRTATAMLCKETTRPPTHMTQTDSGKRDWEGVEDRMRALARLERIWGKSGIQASASNVNVNGLSSSGLSASGEERERRLFTEAVRDGFVLCHLLNKLRSSSIVRPDAKEDGFVRTSNITKFLAACSSYGLPDKDLFQRDDLIEASSESLARVAKTIIALIEFVDAPIPVSDRSKVLSGQGGKPNTSGTNGDSPGGGGTSTSVVSSPYKLGTVASRSAASTSTPNLASGNSSRAISPTKNASGISLARKRWSPPNLLPTVRSDSSEEGTVSKGKTQAAGPLSVSVTQDAQSQRIDTDHPPHASGNQDRDGKDLPMIPPPRSPLRIRTSRKSSSSSPQQASTDDGKSLFTWSITNSTTSPTSPSRISAVESTRASIGDASTRDSIATIDHLNIRQSVASSAMTDMTTSTTTTVLSSLLDVGRASSAGFSKFGTIRTMTTEATSETPSITRTEGSFIAEDLARKHRVAPDIFDRKLSDNAVVDLTRVEEADESSSSSARGGGRDKGKRRAVEAEGERERGRDKNKAIEKGPSPAIRLGKGKWPDDFIDAMQNHTSSNLSISASPISDPVERLRASPISGSPPRKLVVVGLGVSRRNESVESLPQFPRRPSHRARHSIDTAGIQPKEALLRRDASPDGVPARVLPRRHSTKPPPAHLLPKGGANDESDSLVPFPRTVSGDHTNSPSPYSSEDASGSPQRSGKPHQPRGRFQSDIEGSSRRRPRPNSYDELGAKPARSRFESMVNLGGVSGNTSASDLMSRDSIDGSAVRKPLIIKEEGKVPTHFQLGNCIGRGQFGSVYRALNLNTGQMVAVKRIRLEGLKEEEVTQLMREVDLVKRLSHPSIIKYEGMHRDADTLSIVLEYAENGSLGQTVKAFGRLNEKLVASYVVRILEGLHYLHQSDVVHCDLKAANILTTKNGNVKLSDFGVSLNMRAVEREQDVAGTPNWMAPEVIELKGASPKSDIWSLACTVIELLTGRPPYGEIPNSMSVMFRIVEDDMPPIPPGVSPLLEDFLKQCFHKDPAQRPSAELLCEHQWLKQNWGGYKELRPQDSIPFLRRVSADLQKSEVVRYLSQIEMPDATPEHPRPEDIVGGSPPGRRMSNSSIRPSDEISPRDHSFVKTTFSKPMVCRVCLLHVKKSAVLCAQCSLICHSKCQTLAPPTCDLRAQLLLYAQYAEKGNPSSAYSNPADLLGDAHPKSPMSDVAFVSHTPRTSLDTVPPPPPPPPPPPQVPLSPSPASAVHPPVAFKFMNFKRPKIGHHPATDSTNLSSSPSLENMARKPTVLRKAHDDRAPSVKSSSTQANSSMRSAGTVASANRNSEGAADSARASRITSRSGASDADDNRMPGDLSDANRRHRKNKSSNNCIVQ